MLAKLTSEILRKIRFPTARHEKEEPKCRKCLHLRLAPLTLRSWPPPRLSNGATIRKIHSQTDRQTAALDSRVLRIQPIAAVAAGLPCSLKDELIEAETTFTNNQGCVNNDNNNKGPCIAAIANA